MANDVVIIGGGITGLATAVLLKKRGLSILVLEESVHAGGSIRSERVEEFLTEHGPNSTMETNPRIGELIRELGIDGERVAAGSAGKNRFILRRGRLVPLPMNPVAFVTSPLFSARGKVRLLTEPFAPSPTKSDETLAEFVVRRVGKEFLDYAVNPFVAGVFAGDPRRLSVRDALPKLFALEEKYGGLIKGAILGRRERRRRGEVSKQSAGIFSFREGMGTLTAAAARRLGGDLRLGVRAERIEKTTSGGFIVAAGRETFEAASVVVTAQADRAAGLIRPFDGVVADDLLRILYAPVAVVTLGFRRIRATHPLDGFGFLIPEVERRRILGALFTSSIFPGRAPEGGALITAFVGGMRQPELVERSDEDLLEMTIEELVDIIGLRRPPDIVRIRRHPRAIPQYHLGHGAILRSVERFEATHPGLTLGGNYRGGISVADCAASAFRLADRICSHTMS